MGYFDFNSRKRQDGFYDSTSFIRACNVQRALKGEPLFSSSNWWKSKSVKDLIRVLESSGITKYIERSTAKGVSTWVHPVLFIDLVQKLRPDVWLETILANTDMLAEKTIEFLQKMGVGE